LAEQWAKTGNEVCVTSNSSHLTDKLPVFNGNYFYEEINEIRTYWLNTFKVDKGSSSVKRILSWFHFEWRFF
jgi:predicted ATP-dependent endonuclease of OLD family